MKIFTNFYNNLFKNSQIVRRLIAYVLVLSTLITIIISAIHFELDYQKEIKGLNLQFNQIEVSYIKSIETALWKFDHEQLDTLLKGMLNLRDMVHIAIIDNGAISKSFGVLPKSGINREFPLSFQHNERKTDLGTLRVTASDEGINTRLYENLWKILVQNAVIIFSAAIFIFFFVQESITKHLTNISGYAKRIDQSRDLEPLTLSKNCFFPEGENELDDVVVSINEMQKNLHIGYQALIATEDRLKAFAEAASDWLWEMNEDLKFSYVSGRFFEITGLSPSQVIGRGQNEIYTYAEDSLDWLQHQETLAVHEPFRDFTLSLSDPNGKILWLRSSGRPIFDSANQFKGYRGTGTDITNEVRAREEAIETTLRFLDAIENVSDGIAFWDSDDCFVLCNRIFRSQAGEAASQLVRGIPYENYMRTQLTTGTIDIATEDQNDWLQKRLNERKRQKDPVEVYRDGKWLLIRDGRASDGSTVTVTTDITEVKQREQQLQQVTDAVPAGFSRQVQHFRFSRNASAGVLKPRHFRGVEFTAHVISSMSREV